MVIHNFLEKKEMFTYRIAGFPMQYVLYISKQQNFYSFSHVSFWRTNKDQPQTTPFNQRHSQLLLELCLFSVQWFSALLLFRAIAVSFVHGNISPEEGLIVFACPQRDCFDIPLPRSPACGE